MERFNNVPIGSIVEFMGATAPIGWLSCDGTAFSSEEYPELHALIGNTLPSRTGFIIKASEISATTLPIEVAKNLNAKIENNNDYERMISQKHAGKEFLSYIQDAGEKVAGGLYLDRLQDGLWYCKETTSETVNSSKFEDCSNFSNKLRLLDISRFFEHSNFNGDAGCLKVVRTPSLYNSSESQEFDNGLYIVSSHHTGVISQNFFGIVSFSSASPVDSWLDVQGLVSAFDDNTNYRLQFNPKKRKVRNIAQHKRVYTLIRLC